MRSGQFLEVAKLTFDFLTVQRRTGTERRRSRTNPHVRIRVSTESLDGNTHLWELEGTGVTRIDRGGVPHDLMHVGDAISFAANPSRTNAERSD